MLSIQSVMLVALGFLAAALVGLAVAPAFWARAVRLTTRRLKEILPVSEDEVRADKDRMRAEHAIRVHKLETRVEQAQLQRARHLIDINRRDASISQLERQVAGMQGTLDEHQNARLVLEQTVSDRLPRVEQRLSEAKTLLFNRDREIADLSQSTRSQRLALDEAGAINAQMTAEVERLTNALTTRGARNQESMSDPKFEAELALRSEIEALRSKTREQAALIGRMQSQHVRGDGMSGRRGNGMAETAAASSDGTASSAAAIAAAAGDSGRVALERKLRQLSTTVEDQQQTIAGLKASLAAYASDGEGLGGVKDSRIALKARLSASQAEAGQQSETIRKLRAELAASNERNALQAAHFMDEMRRLGAGTLPASAPVKRAGGNGQTRRSLAERVSQSRPQVVPSAKPAEAAVPDARIDDPRPAVVSQDRGGEGNGHDVVHLPTPVDKTPVDKTGADKNGADKNGADKPAAGTAAPGTSRPRLFERISSLSKV